MNSLTTLLTKETRGPILLAMALPVIVIALLLALASTAMSADWCPQGGRFVDRADCINIYPRPGDTETGQYAAYGIENLCNFRVYFHFCDLGRLHSRDQAMPGRPCGTPPQPQTWFFLDPTIEQVRTGWIYGYFHWWAVSCE